MKSSTRNKLKDRKDFTRQDGEKYIADRREHINKGMRQERIGYISNIQHGMQEGDKPGKVGWSQIMEYFR